MAYHEAFWIVIGTAAPVIALAVVVSLPNSFTLTRQSDVIAAGKAGYTIYRTAKRILAAGFINMLLQASLLAVALVSIGNGVNCVPPWTAITVAVGGIVTLAFVSVMSVNIDLYRQGLKLMMRRHLDHPSVDTNDLKAVPEH